MIEKTAAMHNSVKKILLKTHTHEGESPSISPQVTVRHSVPRGEPIHSVKPGTHYRHTTHAAQSVFLKSFGVWCLNNLRPAVANRPHKD